MKLHLIAASLFFASVSATRFERDQFGTFTSGQASAPGAFDSLMGSVGDQSSLHHNTAGVKNYGTPVWGDTIHNGGNSYTKVGFTGNQQCFCPSAGTPGGCTCN